MHSERQDSLLFLTLTLLQVMLNGSPKSIWTFLQNVPFFQVHNAVSPKRLKADHLINDLGKTMTATLTKRSHPPGALNMIPASNRAYKLTLDWNYIIKIKAVWESLWNFLKLFPRPSYEITKHMAVHIQNPDVSICFQSDMLSCKITDVFDQIPWSSSLNLLNRAHTY